MVTKPVQASIILYEFVSYVIFSRKLFINWLAHSKMNLIHAFNYLLFDNANKNMNYVHTTCFMSLSSIKFTYSFYFLVFFFLIFHSQNKKNTAFINYTQHKIGYICSFFSNLTIFGKKNVLFIFHFHKKQHLYTHIEIRRY
jgi:hypothetical protein